MALLTVKNLSFKYPNTDYDAINDISFTINEGEFVVIFGTTGSGKTSLLRLLKPEIAPYGKIDGEILYNGVSLSKVSPRITASEIGYVMQNPQNQIVTDKVWHELAFGLENIGMDPVTIERRIGEMASFFGITTWYHKDISLLSGGEKQLLNLASIMVMQPKLLLLDEPTSQLDPIASGDFIRTLIKLNQEFGLTIVLVEHRLEELFVIADKVMAVDNGKIIAFDTPRNVALNLHNKNLELSMPSAVKIFKGLKVEDFCPLTVREGKNFLIKHYNNLKPNTAIDHANGKVLPSKQTPVIYVQDIWFRYKKDQEDIIKGANLKINQGEIFSIVGSNGSGKSTLLKIIAGIKKPYQGKVLVNGKSIKTYKDDLYFQNLSFLPQNPQDVFIEDSVKKDFDLIAKQHYQSNEDYLKAIEKIDQSLHIKDLLDVHPYDLSGGEQQKVALAKVLLLKPKLLLLDEPTKGLDASLKKELIKKLSELQQSKITILIVTHDIEFAARISDRCAMLFDGKILATSNPIDFFSGNNFYTTAANRIARSLFPKAITEEDVINNIVKNGEVHEQTD